MSDPFNNINFKLVVDAIKNQMHYQTSPLKLPVSKQRSILKFFLVYFLCLSLLWSNIAWAGKGRVDHHEEGSELRPLTTIRPNTFSATRHIDALHIYESGEIIAQDVEGKRSSIKPYNQPQEVRDAIQHGHLMSLLGHFNLYVTKPGEELKIQLMGGLKGGMKKTNIGGKPHMCHFDKGIGICTPIGSGNVSSGGSLKSSLNTRRIPSVGGGSGTSDTYGPTAKDDFRLPSDKPNLYPSNFDPLARSTDPFSPNWDPFQPSTKSHYDQFHIPTPVPQQSYTRYELEQIEQLQKKQHALQEQRELEEQRKQQLAQLDYTLQYHKSKNVPAYTTLTSDEQRRVLDYARDLCRKGQCKPDTDALKQAIKQVVYDTPAHHVLDWYQSLDEPGVQYYKKLTTTHSQQIIETAKELSYNQGKKPDSSTINQAYNQVMTGELRYIFDYHRTQTKAKAYVEALDIQQNAIISTGLYLLKSEPHKFTQPDTSPLSGAFSKIEELGWNQEALHRYRSFTGNQGSLRYTNLNGNVAVLNLRTGLVDPIVIADAYKDGAFLPQGFMDQDRYFEHVGLAITNALGKGVKELWCNTIGVCDVEAVPVGQVLGIGMRALGSKELAKYSINASAALGFAFNNMIKNGHLPQQYLVGGAKILAGIIDDSIKIAKTFKTPIFEGTPLGLLVTEGIIGEPKMNITPLPDDKLDITLTTPIFDNWRQKERIIHMQVTLKDIEFVEMMGKKKANLGDAKPADNGRGVKWDDAPEGNPGKVSNGIRIMKGLGENAPFPSQVDDYVKVIRGGKMLDENGVEVKPGDNGFHKARDNPRTHISKEKWRQWRHPFHPTDPRGGLK